MCLILLAWQVHPEFPLVVAANRDEFYRRPSAPAGFWPDAPEVFAGRDLEAGGTWLGVSRQRRFAALTNYREAQRPAAKSLSRGTLVSRFLTGARDPEDYLAEVAAHAGDYNGFNLFVGDEARLGYFGNRTGAGTIRWLAPGIYGLSNHLLDTPWPKLVSAKAAFAGALSALPDSDGLFSLLADDEIVADHCLPDTGVPIAWERLLSAIFVRSEDYGTRASTVATIARDGIVSFQEKSFGPNGTPLTGLRQQFQSSQISTGV